MCNLVKSITDTIISLNFKFGNGQVKTIIDTGCNYCLMSKSKAKELGLLQKLNQCDINLKSANGSTLNVLGQVTYGIRLSSIQNGCKTEYTSDYRKDLGIKATLNMGHSHIRDHVADDDIFFINWLVIEELSTTALIGTSAFRTLGLIINAVDDSITIGSHVINYGDAVKTCDPICIPANSLSMIECWTNSNKCLNICDASPYPNLILKKGIVSPNEQGNYNILLYNRGDKDIHIDKGNTLAITTIVDPENIVQEDDEHFKKMNIKIGTNNIKVNNKIKRLVRKYRSIFHEYCKAGEQANVQPETLPLKPDAVPQRCPIFAKKPEIHENIEKFAEDLAKRGLTKEQRSDWRANVILLKKKDGISRFIIDYRRLNEQSMPLSYPMPLIQEILANLHGMRCFSKVDFCDGYWGIPLAEESKPITGFATRTKQYVWNVLPQGYINAGNIFQNALNDTLKDMLWNGAMPYVDDIIIYSRNINEHLEKLEQFFSIVKEAGFYLKLRKCEFLMNNMEFLGHTLSDQGLRPSNEKIKAISRLSAPTLKKSV